jgi:hypothetical protein
MKDTNKFDGNRKIPIFKEDLEFENFHSQNLLQMDKDRLNFQKEYCVKISNLLFLNEESKRQSIIQKMISDNNIESFNLEGLNDLNRQEDIILENEVLVLLMQNYKVIKFTEGSIIYQTQFFSYNNIYSDVMIGKLYLALKQKGYINCSRNIFKSIFIKVKNPEKVNWLKTQYSFQYFILNLTVKKNINCSNYWVVASGCFLINGKEKSSKQLARVNEVSLETKQEIDNIMKSFS